MISPGTFITFEGIEGVGKTTLQHAIAKELEDQGYEVILTREPGGTPIAERLRHVILLPHEERIEPVTELLVMFAARAQHVVHVIKPALEDAKIVLCDRFTDTSRAYQGGGRALSPEWIEQLAAMTHPDLEPDLTFWLDAPIELALSRAQSRSPTDRIEGETPLFFEQAKKVYEQLMIRYPKRFYRLDATLQKEALLAEAMTLLNSL